MHFGKVEGVHRVPPMGPRETGIFESSASFGGLNACQTIRENFGNFQGFFFFGDLFFAESSVTWGVFSKIFGEFTMKIGKMIISSHLPSCLHFLDKFQFQTKPHNLGPPNWLDEIGKKVGVGKIFWGAEKGHLCLLLWFNPFTFCFPFKSCTWLTGQGPVWFAAPNAARSGKRTPGMGLSTSGKLSPFWSFEKTLGVSKVDKLVAEDYCSSKFSQTDTPFALRKYMIKIKIFERIDLSFMLYWYWRRQRSPHSHSDRGLPEPTEGSVV